VLFAARFQMTVIEASKKIGVSASKLYQLVAARRIAYYRIGGKIVFAETDIDTFLASCRVGAFAATVASPRVPIKLRHIRLNRNRS
jgi:excisionase family DNA binding protein